MNPSAQPRGQSGGAVSLLQGPPITVGASGAATVLPQPLQVGRHSLFGPRGACLVAADGPLWVADTGHHRLLGWAQRPLRGRRAPDWVIGQRSFEGEAANGGGGATAHSLNLPAGVCRCGDGLAVADAWNHRVLIWRQLPQASHRPADLVLGQADFTAASANRGRAQPAADSLFWPFGVHWDGRRLYVADTGNRRVLIWPDLPQRSGEPATVVLGQNSFDCRDENGGRDVDACGMVWPHAVVCWGERLCVADAGNNRVALWAMLPTKNNTPPTWVLGQNSWREAAHNRGCYAVTAASLSMPYGVAASGDWLLVADTANSRLLAWHRRELDHGAPAARLHGQLDFTLAGDNRWGPTSVDSLCWPYGLDICGDTAVIADTGNNRVQLWSLAP